MKELFYLIKLFLLLFNLFNIINCEVYYVVNNIHESCFDSCLRKGYLCSNDNLINMNCKKSSMTYCEIYLNPYDISKITTTITGCVFNCDQMVYYQGDARTCDFAAIKDERTMPIETDQLNHLCECYSETETSTLFTFPIRIGLILFFISVIILISVVVYQRFYSIRYLPLPWKSIDEDNSSVISADIDSLNPNNSSNHSMTENNEILIKENYTNELISSSSIIPLKHFDNPIIPYNQNQTNNIDTNINKNINNDIIETNQTLTNQSINRSINVQSTASSRYGRSYMSPLFQNTTNSPNYLNNSNQTQIQNQHQHQNQQFQTTPIISHQQYPIKSQIESLEISQKPPENTIVKSGRLNILPSTATSRYGRTNNNSNNNSSNNNSNINSISNNNF